MQLKISSSQNITLANCRIRGSRAAVNVPGSGVVPQFETEELPARAIGKRALAQVGVRDMCYNAIYGYQSVMSMGLMKALSDEIWCLSRI